MAEIRFLGTGGWVATPRRDNTSVLLRAGGKLTLIDCVGSVAAKFRRLKIDPRSVSAVILTHIHPDHTYGLPSLIHSLILEEGEIAVLGSEETVAFARRLLDLVALREQNVRTRVRFQALRPGRVYRLHDALSLRCLRVPHHPSSLSYRFSLPEEKKEILFSGDTPVYGPLFEEARAIDYLVHEASGPARFFRKYPMLYEIHTSALDLGRWSQEAGVKCLIPCHFLADIWSLPAEVRAEIRRHFRGRLIVPRDLQCVPL
jgi:ribonuclease BN (tRNA processing enzyme)